MKYENKKDNITEMKKVKDHNIPYFLPVRWNAKGVKVMSIRRLICLLNGKYAARKKPENATAIVILITALEFLLFNEYNKKKII